MPLQRPLSRKSTRPQQHSIPSQGTADCSMHLSLGMPCRRGSGQFSEAERLSAAGSARPNEALAADLGRRGSSDQRPSGLPLGGPLSSQARPDATQSSPSVPERPGQARPSSYQRMMSWFRRPRPGTPFS